MFNHAFSWNSELYRKGKKKTHIKGVNQKVSHNTDTMSDRKHSKRNNRKPTRVPVRQGKLYPHLPRFDLIQ